MFQPSVHLCWFGFPQLNGFACANAVGGSAEQHTTIEQRLQEYPGTGDRWLGLWTISSKYGPAVGAMDPLCLSLLEIVAKSRLQCAGMNRYEVEDERALRERSSDPLGPESCAVTARYTVKRRQGIGGVGIQLRKDAIRTPTSL